MGRTLAAPLRRAVDRNRWMAASLEIGALCRPERPNRGFPGTPDDLDRGSVPSQIAPTPRVPRPDDYASVATDRLAPGTPPFFEVCRTLRLRVHLGRLRLELESDEGLVADDPCIVTGLDDVRLAGPDLDLRPVFVDGVHRP